MRVSEQRVKNFNPSGYLTSQTRALGTADPQTTTYEREPATNLILSHTDPLNRTIRGRPR